MADNLADLPEEAIVKIESKLFRTYAQLAAIIDSSDDAIISMDLNNLILSWNKAAKTIYGYTSEEVIGKNINILSPVSRASEIHELTKKVIAKERVRNHDMIHRKKDGTEIFVSVTISPIKDDRDEIYGLSMISRDVTEQKFAEEKLNKFDEINRLNRLMVDREVKMVELKEKIKELEEKLSLKK